MQPATSANFLGLRLAFLIAASTKMICCHKFVTDWDFVTKFLALTLAFGREGVAIVSLPAERGVKLCFKALVFRWALRTD